MDCPALVRGGAASRPRPQFGSLRLWDTAAGTAIATEAGCDVVALDGTPLRYDLTDGLLRPGFLVSAPGGAREAFLRTLASATEAARQQP